MTPRTIRDVLAGRPQCVIRCYMTGQVRRWLALEGDVVTINAFGPPPVRVPADTPVDYVAFETPADEDRDDAAPRGHFLFARAAVFDNPPAFASFPQLKLCTEHDKVEFIDGTGDYVEGPKAENPAPIL